MHLEAVAQQRAGGPEHERIDDEEEEPERDQRDRQREHDEYRAHDGIEQADDGGGDQRAGEAVHFDATVDVGHAQQGDCAEQPFEKEFHAPENSTGGDGSSSGRCIVKGITPPRRTSCRTGPRACRAGPRCGRAS